MRGTSRVIRCAMHLIREFFLKFGRLLAFRPGRAVAALIAELVIRGPIPGGAAWERPGENSLTGPKRATRRLINSRTVQFDRSQPCRVMDYRIR